MSASRRTRFASLRGPRRAGAALAAVLCLAGSPTLRPLLQPAFAQDASSPLVLALYAPTAPLPSADARFALVDKLARHLTAAGIPTQAKVFVRASDIEAAIKRGQVDLAVLDSLYLADRGAAYNVLAVSTSAGETHMRWGLYTHLSSSSLLDLSGKRLAWVSPTGTKEPTYVSNVLLYGELRAQQFFGLGGALPDINAAVSDVALHRADCVFAPESAVQGRSLRRVYDAGDAGRIPNPALVQVSERVTADVATGVRKAVSSFSTTGALDGWKSGGSAGDALRSLRSRMRGHSDRNLVFAEPQRPSTQITSAALAAPTLEATLPGLSGLLLPPSDIP